MSRAAPKGAAAQALAHTGASVFFRLLRDLLQVPEVLLPGKAEGQDNSTAYGLREAHSLIAAAIEEAGFTAVDPARATGFAAGLSWYLMAELNGYSRGLGEIADDATEALAQLELATDARRPIASRDVARSAPLRSDGPVRIYSTAEVAALLSCTAGTVEQMARDGRLAGIKPGGGWVFPAGALARRLYELALEGAAQRRQPAVPAGVAVKGGQQQGNGRSQRVRPVLPDLRAPASAATATSSTQRKPQTGGAQ